MKKKSKHILICIAIIILFTFITWVVCRLSTKNKIYTTQLGYTITVPYFSKIEDRKDPLEKDNGINEKITIVSHQNTSSEEMVKNLVKESKKMQGKIKTTKSSEYEEIVLYYNSQENYTIDIEDQENKKITIRLYKGNRFQTLIEDTKYIDTIDENLIGGFRTDNSGLVKVYNNIYTYNISDMVFSYKKESNLNYYSYSLKDIIQYKYYTIDDIINTYNELVNINYGKKKETDKYILYSPKKRDNSQKLIPGYSILICNNKYIFGNRNLEYSENLCKEII